MQPMEHHPHTEKGNPPHARGKDNTLRLVAWETTRNCNLSCVHCRAAATKGPYAGELDSDQALKLLDEIAEVGKPIVILTGGEPLLRKDIFDITKHGDRLGLRMVMAPNGTLITPQVAEKMAASGIRRISASIDGATKAFHDKFRGVDGAFDAALSAASNMSKLRELNFRSTPPSRKAIWTRFPGFLNWPNGWVRLPIIFFCWYPPGGENISWTRPSTPKSMKPR
jgi:MoaA/NifB/PqqE/SkfB family radical SAM enzyme